LRAIRPAQLEPVRDVDDEPARYEPINRTVQRCACRADPLICPVEHEATAATRTGAREPEQRLQRLSVTDGTVSREREELML
jgi:hypothetical protein